MRVGDELGAAALRVGVVVDDARDGVGGERGFARVRVSNRVRGLGEVVAEAALAEFGRGVVVRVRARRGDERAEREEGEERGRGGAQGGGGRGGGARRGGEAVGGGARV